MMEALEDRRLMAAEPPYNIYKPIVLVGFTSFVPLQTIGGNSLDLAIKVINPTKEVQRGLIDITFVLDPYFQGKKAVADKFDPVLAQQTNVLLNLKPKGSQVFKARGLIPDDQQAGTYWVAAALDPGGSIEANTGFGTTVAAAPTRYQSSFTDVTVGKFSIRLSRKEGIVSGNVAASVTNFGNIPATGSVTLKVYAATKRTPSSTDIFVNQQSVDLNALKFGGKVNTNIAFFAPSGLTESKYYIRIEILRNGLPRDLRDSANANVFSTSTVALK